MRRYASNCLIIGGSAELRVRHSWWFFSWWCKQNNSQHGFKSPALHQRSVLENDNSITLLRRKPHKCTHVIAFCISGALSSKSTLSIRATTLQQCNIYISIRQLICNETIYDAPSLILIAPGKECLKGDGIDLWQIFYHLQKKGADQQQLFKTFFIFTGFSQKRSVCNLTTNP